MKRRPTLLEGCSRAATAAEARFRVGYPNSAGRSSRVIALDAGAATLVGRFADGPWNGARFLTYVSSRSAPGLGSLHVDADLRAVDGSESRLGEELQGTDLAVMIASSDRAAEAASVVGDACAARGILTAGLVVAGDRHVEAAISALRPHANVLVVAREEDFIPEMLAALRA